jgi:predicted Zn-dependent peptidase
LETVGNLTREDLLGYRNRYYQPNFISVVAAGDITPHQLLDVAKHNFSSVKPGDHKRIDLFRAQPSKPVSKFQLKKTEQTHLALGLHSLPKDHADQYVMDMLNLILGGNMSSRLFNEVRENRGLAYEIGSFERQYQETGAFIVSAGVDNRKVKEALRIILKELHKITRRPVTSQELKRAKEFYLGQLELGLENTMNHMMWVGESVTSLGRCKTLEEVKKGVREVTPPRICEVAKKVLRPASLHLAAIGPKIHELENYVSTRSNFWD